MDTKLLTPEDVAERLTVNAATVRSWLRKGNLKGLKIGKRVWRISEDELNYFLLREQCYEGKDLSSQVRESSSDIKESLFKDLDELSMQSLEKIYNLATELKEEEAKSISNTSTEAYMRVRQVLSGFSGSLADELSKERDDRL
jgi:excisionase family DNA binding protein